MPPLYLVSLCQCFTAITSLVFNYLHFKKSIDINVMICLCFSYSSEVFFLSDKRYIQSQQDWIEADLSAANNNRHITPWIVAYGHRPMYCSNDDGDDCTKNTSLVRLGFVMLDMLELVLYCLSFPLGQLLQFTLSVVCLSVSLYVNDCLEKLF